ncbi:unnamed protein product [Mesocestoides corti]|uniref:Estradiol 17-beta-dehydrogenase 12 n=1 Tax=Mesocestoides corti TaxID=53468 RepID=A0A0R3UDK3_MESCO|nr:unnamed protein product [Mesocestoides corti]
MFCCLLSVIGALFCTYVVCFLLWPVLAYYVLRFCLSRRGDLKRAGEWAVVTGATDGIGKAFCELLAKEGLNVFLISRSEDKLRAVAESLQNKYRIKTKVFVADCTKDDFYERLQSELCSLSSISCLFNNVGLAYKHPDDLCTSDFLTPGFCQDIITVNATTLTKITRLVLPKMINDPLPTPGVYRYIINIGSFAGLFSIAYLTVYSASKAYVQSFSKALAGELRHTCVRTQLFTPAFIATNMSGMEPSSKVPSAMTYANSALSMIGVEAEGCGYFNHEMSSRLIQLMPSFYVSRKLSMSMLRTREVLLRRNQKKSN